MSTQTNSGKPYTAGFELQTKIRVIIQQVLAATVRKLSQFNEKVQTFEDFFFTFKQRIGNIEQKSNTNDNSIQNIRQMLMKNKGQSDSSLLKLQQRFQKTRIQNNEIKSELNDNQKKFATISRQNQNMNNEFSKTKAKFLQFSDQINATKDQVSWKITKYVQQTAAANTQIKINHQQMKQDTFNMKLSVDRSLAKYDQIIQLKDQEESRLIKFDNNINQLFKLVQNKDQKIQKLNKKLEDMDTALYNKMRQSQLKQQKKIQQLIQSNLKITKSVKKIQQFTKDIQDLKEQTQRNYRNILKRIQQNDQKFTNNLDTKILDLNRSILQSDKNVQKKLKGVTQSQQKFVDFFNQKIQYLKMEIQTQLSSKATAMLQEKSKTQEVTASSAVESLQQKINKMSLQTLKSINKVQNNVKDMKREVDNRLQDFKQGIQTRVEKVVSAFDSSSGSGVSPEFMQSLNQRFQKVIDDVDYKIYNMNKDIGQQNLKILGLQKLKQQTLSSMQDLGKENVQKFQDLQSKTAQRVQKLMFLVSKMRGDNIIRNQFVDKALRQIKKFNQDTSNNFQLTFKLIPAFGQIINIIMCLIYDAEYQHSKIIGNDLPGLTKETQKFQNIIQGVLYQYKDNKKPGIIHYRHKQMKKTDIVKAAFHAYTTVWQQIFEKQTQFHSYLVPKIFFKQKVQKLISARISNITSGIPTRGHKAGSLNAIKNQSGSKQKAQGSVNTSKQKYNGLNSNSNTEKDSSQNMNKSFQIRKKKGIFRSRQDVIVINQGVK